MKKLFHKAFDDISFLVILCTVYTCGALALLLQAKWYVWALMAVICGCIIFFGCIKMTVANRNTKDTLRAIKTALNTAKRTGNSAVIYNALENIILPELRNNLPQRLFKYYSLGDDELSNNRKISTFQNKEIWASVYSEFNDPFECQYMYMKADDFEEAGFPPLAKSLWEIVMDELRQRITTICFTQNPNDMPMWAHYANEHKGFCVEYQVTGTSHLYPVMYTEKRLKAQVLFVDLIYVLFNPDVPSLEKTNALKHVMLLSAFKDKSWESENEIRAIFMSSKSQMSEKGRSITFDGVGVLPCKIYIGAMCSETNREKLISIAQNNGIEHQLCRVSGGENFSVLGE